MDIIRECRQVAPHCPRRSRRVALRKPRSRFQVVKRKRTRASMSPAEAPRWFATSGASRSPRQRNEFTTPFATASNPLTPNNPPDRYPTTISASGGLCCFVSGQTSDLPFQKASIPLMGWRHSRLPLWKTLSLRNGLQCCSNHLAPTRRFSKGSISPARKMSWSAPTHLASRAVLYRKAWQFWMQ